MNRELVACLFIAAVLVLMLAFSIFDTWTAKPDGPDYGLALVVEDPTHLDDCSCETCEGEHGMEAYLAQRAAGNGVLPAPDDDEAAIVRLVEERRHEPTYSKQQVMSEVLGVPFRPHTECVNRWADGEPHRVHARCRAAIEAGVPR